MDVVDLAYKFFEIYSSYDWKNPVAIKFGNQKNLSLKNYTIL